MALRHRSFARSGHESVRFVVSGMPHSRLVRDNGPVNRGLRSGRRRSTSLVTRFAVLLLGVGVALGLAALSAWAHSAVVSISPPDGATLSTPPTRVVITFNEDIDPNFVEVALSTEGRTVELGEPVVDGPKVSADVKVLLGPATYLLAFHVISADTHSIRGSSTFTVSGTTTAPPAGTSTGSPSGTATSNATTGPSSSDSPTGATSTTPAATQTLSTSASGSTPEPTPTYKTPQKQPTTIGHPDHTPGLIVAGGLLALGALLTWREHRRRPPAD